MECYYDKIIFTAEFQTGEVEISRLFAVEAPRKVSLKEQEIANT